MTSFNEILHQKRMYYSSKCFANNFHLYNNEGTEIPHKNLKYIKEKDFSKYEIIRSGEIAIIEYDQNEFIFCENELFSIVYSLINQTFKMSKVTIFYDNREVSPNDKIMSSRKYDIKVECNFTFIDQNDNEISEKMDYLSTILDAKKVLTYSYKNKNIIPECIVILDENKKEITNKKRKLISIFGYEKSIFFRLNDEMLKQAIFIKEFYGNVNAVTKYLFQEGLFLSKMCYENNFHLLKDGIEIDRNKFKFEKKIYKKQIEINLTGSTITINYDGKNFIFQENENIYQVYYLVSKALNNKVDIQILDSNDQIKNKTHCLTKSEQYYIKANYNFNFKQFNGDCIVRNMEYTSTILNATYILANLFCNDKIECIVLYDNNKNQINDIHRQLKTIQNFDEFIYFEIINYPKNMQIKPNKLLLNNNNLELEKRHLESDHSSKEDEKIVAIKDQGESKFCKSRMITVKIEFDETNQINDYFPDEIDVFPESTIDDIRFLISIMHNIKDIIVINYKFCGFLIPMNNNKTIDKYFDVICDENKINHLYIEILPNTDSNKNSLSAINDIDNKNDKDNKSLPNTKVLSINKNENKLSQNANISKRSIVDIKDKSISNTKVVDNENKKEKLSSINKFYNNDKENESLSEKNKMKIDLIQMSKSDYQNENIENDKKKHNFLPTSLLEKINKNKLKEFCKSKMKKFTPKFNNFCGNSKENENESTLKTNDFNDKNNDKEEFEIKPIDLIKESKTEDENGYHDKNNNKILKSFIEKINQNKLIKFRKNKKNKSTHDDQIFIDDDEEKHESIINTYVSDEQQTIKSINKEEEMRDNEEDISLEKLETFENSSEQQTTKESIEIKYSKIIEELEERIKIIEQDKENLNAQILEQSSKIAKLEKEVEISKSTTANTQNNCQPFISKLDKNSPGILQRLKNNEKSPFDHLFIPSQSSGDIYNVIDPNTNDSFSITDIGNFIEIELEETITITGIKLFSSTDNFPKTFDIEINNEKVSSIKEAKELNGKNQEMTININPIRCNKIRITNRGQNWDEEDNYADFKRIELLSNESKYSSGVFSTLVSQSENHDPHKCPVLISSSSFDSNIFHLIDSTSIICTNDNENSWFQIEFTKGKAIINGFRLKRCDSGKLKQYRIICTDDVYKPLEEWSTLIEINEKSKKEHEKLDIYEFSQPSPPIKFARLIQTGPNWNDNNYLEFYHLDFFGSYF